MIKIDVFVKDRNWRKYISNPKRHLKSRLKYINNSIQFIKNNKINFSILLAGSNEIKRLNKKFRKKDKITDVLSFPNYKNLNLKKIKKKDIYLGDLILNFYKIDKKILKKSLINFGYMAFSIFWATSITKIMIIIKCANLKKKYLLK